MITYVLKLYFCALYHEKWNLVGCYVITSLEYVIQHIIAQMEYRYKKKEKEI